MNLQKVNTSLSPVQEVKSLLASDSVKKRFLELLGNRANGFISSVLNAMNNNALLAKCEPNTIIASAAIAASMDLPIDSNLGFAALVPYEDTKTGKYLCQFQMMSKGFVQLAIRSGQYKTINNVIIYEGQLVSENPLTGEYIFDFNVKSDKVIGYASYFKLISGFEKTYYMTVFEAERHGMKYSKSFKKGKGLWSDKVNGGFDSMGLKTVIKLSISKFGIMSIDTQKIYKGIEYDQAVVSSIDAPPIYIDHEDSMTKDGTIDSTDLKTKNINKSMQNKPKPLAESKPNSLYEELTDFGMTEALFNQLKSIVGMDQFKNLEEFCEKANPEQVKRLMNAEKPN